MGEQQAPRGGAECKVMIAQRKLEFVKSDPILATMQLQQAAESLAIASENAELAPDAALTLAYDAARKSIVAILEAQGLRVRMPNAHVNTQEALRAQWGDGLADRFDVARRARNRAEYPSESTAGATPSTAKAAVTLALELLELARAQVPHLGAFPR